MIDRDQDLDAEYAAGLRRLLTRAMEDPRQLEVTVEAAFVLKSLERIGDHARNLARHVQAIAATRSPCRKRMKSGDSARYRSAAQAPSGSRSGSARHADPGGRNSYFWNG